MSEHTPTPNLGLPWYADQDQREGYEWNVHVVEHNNPNMRVCFMANGPNSVERAAHLVKCVNSHDDLVRALNMFVNRMVEYGNWDDGCFYYNRISASELQEPINLAKAALASIKESV